MLEEKIFQLKVLDRNIHICLINCLDKIFRELLMNKSRQTDNPVKALMRKLLQVSHLYKRHIQFGEAAKFSGPNVFTGSSLRQCWWPTCQGEAPQGIFPEHRFNFNLVYTLSNTPYLSEQALRHIKKKNIPLVLNQNGVFYPGWFGSNWAKHNLIMSKAYHSADHVSGSLNFVADQRINFWVPEISRERFYITL